MFQRFAPGAPLSASALNRMTDEIRRGMHLTGDAPIEVVPMGTGYHLRWAGEDIHIIEITEVSSRPSTTTSTTSTSTSTTTPEPTTTTTEEPVSATRYGFKEKQLLADGRIVDKQGGLVGTVDGVYALHFGFGEAQVGDYALAWRGQGAYFVFVLLDQGHSIAVRVTGAYDATAGYFPCERERLRGSPPTTTSSTTTETTTTTTGDICGGPTTTAEPTTTATLDPRAEERWVPRGAGGQDCWVAINEDVDGPVPTDGTAIYAATFVGRRKADGLPIYLVSDTIPTEPNPVQRCVGTCRQHYNKETGEWELVSNCCKSLDPDATCSCETPQYCGVGDDCEETVTLCTDREPNPQPVGCPNSTTTAEPTTTTTPDCGDCPFYYFNGAWHLPDGFTPPPGCTCTPPAAAGNTCDTATVPGLPEVDQVGPCTSCRGNCLWIWNTFTNPPLWGLFGPQGCFPATCCSSCNCPYPSISGNECGDAISTQCSCPAGEDPTGGTGGGGSGGGGGGGGGGEPTTTTTVAPGTCTGFCFWKANVSLDGWDSLGPDVNCQGCTCEQAPNYLPLNACETAAVPCKRTTTTTSTTTTETTTTTTCAQCNDTLEICCGSSCECVCRWSGTEWQVTVPCFSVFDATCAGADVCPQCNCDCSSLGPGTFIGQTAGAGCEATTTTTQPPTTTTADVTPEPTTTTTAAPPAGCCNNLPETLTGQTYANDPSCHHAEVVCTEDMDYVGPGRRWECMWSIPAQCVQVGVLFCDDNDAVLNVGGIEYPAAAYFPLTFAPVDVSDLFCPPACDPADIGIQLDQSCE